MNDMISYDMIMLRHESLKKYDILSSVKIQNCSKTLKKIKRQTIDWKKTFDKGLIYRT